MLLELCFNKQNFLLLRANLLSCKEKTHVPVEFAREQVKLVKITLDCSRIVLKSSILLLVTSFKPGYTGHPYFSSEEK